MRNSVDQVVERKTVEHKVVEFLVHKVEAVRDRVLLGAKDTRVLGEVRKSQEHAKEEVELAVVHKNQERAKEEVDVAAEEVHKNQGREEEVELAVADTKSSIQSEVS